MSDNKSNDDSLNKIHEIFPRWILIVYFIAIFFVFVASCFKNIPLKVFNQQTTLDFSKTAWLLPILIFLPYVLKFFSKKGGTIEGFGIKAQFNKVREEVKEEIRNTGDTTEIVASDLESSIDDLIERIGILETNVPKTTVNKQPVTEKPKSNIEQQIDRLVEEYRKAISLRAIDKRKMIDRNVQELSDQVSAELVFNLLDKTKEHNLIAAQLLSQFNEDPSRAEKAFQELVRLSITGNSSLIRYRAARSLNRKPWYRISKPLLKESLIKIKRRIDTEPNVYTVNELQNAYKNLIKLS